MKELIARRDKRGDTQIDVAVFVGVHPQAVSNWERGVNMPRSKHLKRLAQYFGCRVSDLFGDDDRIMTA